MQLCQIAANGHFRLRQNLCDGFCQFNDPEGRFMNHCHRNAEGDVLQLFSQNLLLSGQESVKCKFPCISSTDGQCSNSCAATRNRNHTYSLFNAYPDHFASRVRDAGGSCVRYQHSFQILRKYPFRQCLRLIVFVVPVTADQRCVKTENLTQLHRYTSILGNNQSSGFHRFHCSGR